MKLKRLLSFLLAAGLILSCVGCTPSTDQNGQPAPTDAPAAQSVLFEDYLMDTFREAVGDNLLDSRFYLRDPAKLGITDVPLNIGRIDFEEIDNGAAEWETDYKELTAFVYEELTPDQQSIYDLMKYNMDLSKPMMEVTYLDEYNSPLLGIQSQLPTLLPEFQLYTVQDAYDYITMLGNIHLYFEDMLEYQRRKSEKGTFMSDSMLDQMIESCRSFLKNPEQNVLITGFGQRLEGLPDITDQQTKELLELNEKAVREEMMPTYETFIAEMEKLRGTGKNEGGLCGLPDGKEYYEYIAQSGTGSDRTVTEMAKMLDEQIQTNYSNIMFILAGDRDVLDRYMASEPQFGSPEEIMEILRESTVEDFPPVPQLNYRIESIAPEMEEHSSPAFYIIPQVDNSSENTIYINNKYVKDDNLYLFTTMAHEGYPGHLYQNCYFNSTSPHPIRRLLDTSGYGEGWASYVENLAYEMTGITDIPMLRLMQIDNAMGLLISSRADIGVNYEGWDKEALAEFLAQYGFNQEDTVNSIFESVVQDPANYLKYSIGMLEFQKLRRYAENELEDAFRAVDFHKAVLDVGAVPFTFVKKAVDDYIANTAGTGDGSDGASGSESSIPKLAA